MTKVSANDISLDVNLTQLETMALLMLLQMQEDDGGLSGPERSAKEKLRDNNVILLNMLRLAEW